MEEIFEKFNAVVDEMADAVAAAETQEEADRIQAEYDIKIDEAQKVLDAEIENFLTEEDARLEAEQKESKLPIDEPDAEEEEDDLTPIEQELKFLRDSKATSDFITKRYNKTNTNRNGYSTSELYKYLGGTGNPKEADMADYIIEKL